MQATVQTLQPCATEISNHTQNEGCAQIVNAVHERLSADQFAEGTAALRCLQTKIEACSKEVLQSSFHNSFKRLLEYVQRQNLMDNTFEQCKSQKSFRWENATELVIYGLGSPAAGGGLFALVPTAPNAGSVSICYETICFTHRHFQPVKYPLFVVHAGARPVHCQLAFLVLLQTLLPSLKHTRAFDPVFTSMDIALLQSFNIEVYSASKLVKKVNTAQLPIQSCMLSCAPQPE